jgi:hypothetical protein
MATVGSVEGYDVDFLRVDPLWLVEPVIRLPWVVGVAVLLVLGSTLVHESALGLDCMVLRLWF